jgi:hypothetical protein
MLFCSEERKKFAWMHVNHFMERVRLAPTFGCFYQLIWALAYKSLCSEDRTACVIGSEHAWPGAPWTAGYRAPEVLLRAHNGTQTYECVFNIITVFLASLL